MPYYTYKAIDQDGIIHKGELYAQNSFEIEQRLQALDFNLIHCKEVKSNYIFKQKKIKRTDLINFTFQMEQLISSGIPLLEGLVDLRESMQSGYFRHVLSNIISSIHGGKTFSDTLKEHPTVFDQVYISLIQVGETTGKLDTILKDLTNNLKWIDELTSHAKKIFIYPTIVGCTLIGVLSFMMIFLVPQLVPFIEEMAGEIPLPTKLLVATSNIFSSYWPILFGTPIIFTIGIRYLSKKNDYIKYKVDLLFLKVPLFGSLLFKIKLARFTNYLALMYASGLTILEALNLCTNLVNNMVIGNSILKAKKNIEEGQQISISFGKTAIFPPLTIRMLNVGEKTGNIDKALRNASYFYDREAKDTIAKIEQSIEPIITFIMGSLMLWIILAVLSPVYNVIVNFTH